MKRFLITLILMLSIFSIASAHPFKSEKELYNYYAEIDKKINEELNEEIFVLATGGLGKILSAEIDEIDEYDPNLSLKGLYTLYKLNK